jgi:hypothetical protein
MTFARMKRAFAALLLAAGLCGASSGFAARAESPQEPAAAGDAANGRYAMTPVAEGFLRLDTRSGQVSLCTVQKDEAQKDGAQNVLAQCRASADERAALQVEIDRLAKENAALKAQGVNPKAAAEDEDDRRFDKALDRAERFMRRMMQLFRDPSGKPPPTSL